MAGHWGNWSQMDTARVQKRSVFILVEINEDPYYIFSTGIGCNQCELWLGLFWRRNRDSCQSYCRKWTSFWGNSTGRGLCQDSYMNHIIWYNLYLVTKFGPKKSYRKIKGFLTFQRSELMYSLLSLKNYHQECTIPYSSKCFKLVVLNSLSHWLKNSVISDWPMVWISIIIFFSFFYNPPYNTKKLHPNFKDRLKSKPGFLSQEFIDRIKSPKLRSVDS